MKIQSDGHRSGGFALIITLALMVLLTLIVVGLLSLSSVAMRTAADGSAMATARANARLALMLALGELQRSAGVDQRVTARADVLDEKIANPRLTGVWESVEIKATAPPAAADYKASTKDGKFRAWLASTSDPASSRKAAFAGAAMSSPVTLWGKGTLGDKGLATGRVNASKVPLTASIKGKTSGALAWAVLDEGIKVRVNTPYTDAATAVGAKTVQLGAGERPGVEFIDGLSGFNRQLFDKNKAAFATIEKGISRLNYGLAAQNLGKASPAVLQSLTHDVTTQSVGLFTDTAHGGLKKDFQLLTNAPALPASYKDSGVYASLLGLPKPSVPSDPTWASLRDFSRLYSDKLLSSGGVPYLKSQLPTTNGWQAAKGDPPNLTITRTPPPGLVLLPTIAKVQMLFSLVANDIYLYERGQPVSQVQLHGPQGDWFAGTKYLYELDLQYTPIVTLYNPYNVAIECNEVHFEFLNVPFAATVYRNGAAQNTGLAPLDQMFFTENENGTVNKRFAMTLKDKASDDTPGSTTFRMLPGEVKIFSPYIDPTHTWRQEQQGNRIYWDFDSKDASTNITQNIVAIPGWRGDGIGFVLDWWDPAPMRIVGTADEQRAAGRWDGCLGLAPDDKIHVVFAPQSMALANNKFVVQMTTTPNGSTTPVSTGALEFDYETSTGLRKFILGSDSGTLRYPATGDINGIDLFDHQTVPIKERIHAKPFCLISAQGKTTSGGHPADNLEGRLATKPWCFAHANIVAATQKVLSEHSANFSHEIDFQELEKGSSDLVGIDQQDRGNFISGLSRELGVKFGGLYDIPLAPLQNFASLNGANPGGSSGYLPRFAQPIGNSWAHPLISPGKLMEVKSGGNYLDHSFLLNLAFYDSFYFSGLAAQGGPFGSGKTTPTLAANFAAGQSLDDPRLLLHQPNSRPASDLATDLLKTDAHTRIAAWQLMAGSFNVNSTSVLAWKAMLASIHDSQALFNQLNKAAKPPSSMLVNLTAEKKAQARISRLRLPVSMSAADGAELKDGYWLGPREYTDYQLQGLAESIVKQVRLRGPFLSMAEFVNRQLGSGQAAQCGALQQAIDETTLNQGIAAGAEAGFEIPAAKVASYKYVNPPAGSGPSYQGAPGYLTQADLLNVLGNAATARSDTFTIRGYGEARDAAGKILAHATCEAVVQRFPEWVDPADPVETGLDKLTSQANKTFGRRFLITSLRWLNSDEI
ncbi:MAG: hypothetical protein WCK77_09905 [Verrucomicrobiota bacterium]